MQFVCALWLPSPLLCMNYIYKTKRGCRTRPCIDVSGQPNINLRARPVGPLEGRYWADREHRYTAEYDISEVGCVLIIP